MFSAGWKLSLPLPSFMSLVCFANYYPVSEKNGLAKASDTSFLALMPIVLSSCLEEERCSVIGYLLFVLSFPDTGYSTDNRSLVAGTIVEATCTNVQGFAAGAFLYQVGYTSVILLVEVIVADTTSLRSRLFFSYIPATPFIINTWVSGDVSDAVLAQTTWRWGIGMWCIIYPICSLPLIVSLWWVGRKARKAGSLANYKTPYQMYGASKLAVALFWQLDVIGIILLIMVFGFILVPFTIAGGESQQWNQAKIIAPLVIGIVTVPVWIWWEKKAPHPMVPFHVSFLNHRRREHPNIP